VIPIEYQEKTPSVGLTTTHRLMECPVADYLAWC